MIKETPDLDLSSQTAKDTDDKKSTIIAFPGRKPDTEQGGTGKPPSESTPLKLVSFEDAVTHYEDKQQAVFEALVFELQKAVYSLYEPELYEKIKHNELKVPIPLPNFEFSKARLNPDMHDFIKRFTPVLIRHSSDTQDTTSIVAEDVIQEFYARDRVLKSETSE